MPEIMTAKAVRMVVGLAGLGLLIAGCERYHEPLSPCATTPDEAFKRVSVIYEDCGFSPVVEPRGPVRPIGAKA